MKLDHSKKAVLIPTFIALLGAQSPNVDMR
jgi:hypothetical protein